MLANLFLTLQVVRHSCQTPITNLITNLEIINSQLTTHQQRCFPALIRAKLSASYLQEIMAQTYFTQLASQKFKVNLALNELLNLIPQPENSFQLIPLINLPTTLTLAGNKLSFQETIICLINNAFEAYPPQSTIRLVVLSARLVQSSLIIKVMDGARGFNNLILADHGYQAKSTKLNGGQGLTFAQQIVSNHFHGQLKIKNLSPRGSLVIIKIPLA